MVGSTLHIPGWYIPSPTMLPGWYIPFSHHATRVDMVHPELYPGGMVHPELYLGGIPLPVHNPGSIPLPVHNPGVVGTPCAIPGCGRYTLCYTRVVGVPHWVYIPGWWVYLTGCTYLVWENVARPKAILWENEARSNLPFLLLFLTFCSISARFCTFRTSFWPGLGLKHRGFRILLTRSGA